MMLKIQIGKKPGKHFKIVFPIVVVWFFMLLVMLIFAPFMIFIALVTWPLGYGKLILMFPVMIFSIITSMTDLMIDIKDDEDKIFISFY